ncbi:MAG: shikimate kinase [Chloroflexi bacterium]|nr:shikimate kinase [Chloroflexota bacterium]
MQSDQVRNIILVGFMASGKSSVGRAISRHCGWIRVDADDEIVARAGKPISHIFRDSGEDAFRKLERAVIKDLCRESQYIIAAGGGSFIDAENRRSMLEGGTVFYLSARPETIHRRVTRGNPNVPARPLLGEGNPLSRIQELLAERAPIYAKAHYAIETDDLSTDQVADAILAICGPRMSKRNP